MRTFEPRPYVPVRYVRTSDLCFVARLARIFDRHLEPAIIVGAVVLVIAFRRSVEREAFHRGRFSTDPFPQ